MVTEKLLRVPKAISLVKQASQSASHSYKETHIHNKCFKVKKFATALGIRHNIELLLKELTRRRERIWRISDEGNHFF